MKKKVILLAGPTASGKSALAMDWAERIGGVIINADSMQVYREMRIMTARPSEADEARVPHRLYGFRPGDTAYSAAAWVADAEAALRAAWDEGLVPIVTGGTGLYFHTLLNGMAVVPEIPDHIREEVRDAIARLGPEALHADLQQRDPAMAARLTPRDRQRIARAQEVIRATGRSLLDWQAEPSEGGLRREPDVDIDAYVLEIDRALLYERCEKRLDIMLEDEGGLEEIGNLLALGYQPDLPVMKVLGVPEFARYFRHEISYDDAVMLTKTSTRQFAKRQMTWMRNQFPDWKRLSSSELYNNFL